MTTHDDSSPTDGTPDDSEVTGGSASVAGTPAPPTTPKDDAKPAERPRPQYGEYATPAEQARAMGIRYVPPVPIQTSRTPSLAQPTSQPMTPPARTAQPAQPTTPRSRPAPGARRPRGWDAFLTSLLLGFGAIWIFNSFASYSNLTASLATFYTEAGVTGTPPTVQAWVGPVLNTVTIAIWVVTFIISMRVLRSGRVTFWVPITGAVVTQIAAAVILAFVLFSDPSFLSHLSQVGAGG